MSTNRCAISLLEVLVAIFVLAVGLLAVAAMLVPAQHELREADRATRAVECGRAGLADAVVRGVLDPHTWRNTDGSKVGTPRPTPTGAATHDETPGFPWGETYAIDPLYVATRADAASEGTEPGVVPAHYAACPYRADQPGTTLFNAEWTRRLR